MDRFLAEFGLPYDIPTSLDVDFKSDFNVGIVAGSLGTALLILLLFVVIPALINRDVYDLSHWKLNQRTPIQPMWMNLGFWKTPRGDKILHLDQACATLLREVLVSSGILGRELAAERISRPQRSIAILDVGFGCGDQTWELARALEAPTWNEYRYVGLTVNPAQLEVAQQRQEREIAAANKRGVQLWPGSFRLFQADAGRPDSWERPVKTMVEVLGDTKFTDKWFLALDCMYHFSPSRVPILRYTSQKLGANLMAFDLLMNDKASRFGALMARTIGYMGGSPFSAFLTESQYTELLVASGYDRESIMIRDISYDVFPGLVAFLDRQQRALKPYGITLGRYNVAKRIFRWFGNSGTVRAAIVVAKLKQKTS